MVVMSQFDPKKNNNAIFALAFAIAALILVNGAFAFWQMQQVKQEFEDVANRDLPLVSQLLPLIDRQFEQTLLIEKLDKLGPDHRAQVIFILQDSFLRTGEKFKTTLNKLNQFIAVQTPSATEQTRRELGRVNAMLGQIGQEHQQYQQQVAWMVEAIKGNQSPFETSVITQVSKQEKALRTELLAMRDEVQLFTQNSADAVEKHEALVIKETTVFTLFVFSLGAAMLFFIRKVMAARDDAINEITYYATFDSLTKLYNRRYFNERFDQAIKAATRHDQPLSLCLCDLDHFKKINDIQGHQAGDIALVGFADILTTHLRADDVAGRFGGDEFVLFFPNTNAADAVKLLERIRRKLANKVFHTGQDDDFSITATFGVSELSLEAKTVPALLSIADKALYKAKEKGRDRVHAL